MADRRAAVDGRRVRRAVGVMFFATVLLFSLDMPKPLPRVLELSLYVAWFVLLSAFAPLRELWARLSRLQRRLLIGLAVAMVVGQVVNKSHRTYPFVPWRMYTASMTDPPTWFEYVGIREGGREVVIHTREVFPSQRGFMMLRLNELLNDSVNAADEARRRRSGVEFQRLLNALVHRFNTQEQSSPVRRVRTFRCTLPNPAPGRELAITRQAFGEFDIEPES